ncbi:NADPH-dependent ferric siderophore reductase [Kibdelosporangium banguiense]|uniref:NADPH-dependent ferric siderophore reductase n=1 Tax=Kibdelosporangium banguiense TaxID=1365924 RepID=A0ABS4U048_9PSEU|nr:hypothetical protein [Kibdelosporangium banguiense]MBP2330029.1 NADPH-dependent ferric siderophore reductase [Kibdelosporangium banguiense]
MPKAPAVIGSLFESVFGRPSHVLDVAEPAPGFLELEVRAAPPIGGWHPGHEIQLRVAPGLTRRYTVRAVSGADADRIGILVATDAEGPGTTWMRRLRAGTGTTLLAGPHLPLRQNGTRRLYLGDSSALGAINAYAQSSDGHVVTVETSAEAVSSLTSRWPRYTFLAATSTPGDALQAWLERAVDDGTLTGLDAAVLLGHAQSIQRQRRVLIDRQVMPRRALTTKPYWANGKQGL